jgi:pilus assembly protein Flp/PilA
MSRMLKALWTEEDGQGLMEYALLLAMVSLGLFLVVTNFRDELGDVFDNVIEELQEAEELD